MKTSIELYMNWINRICRYDGRVHPHVEVLVLLARDLEAEVGAIAADVPGAQALVQPFRQLVGDFRLDAALRPIPEEAGELRQIEEEVV